uniref:Transcriptional regulator, AlpA family n=1 Tax=Candidatus Kentrum sp. UNK TaxID=2126344 RepID=A0A450ZWE9_9GAMM|nr:MAG: transcriptional regulator, AlpA family [Candidatus Kentron sp. UNK]VFK68258.1 MAG: transcriptional regulator, AlpA family [Candidatus Kentron sp. UNK]
MATAILRLPAVKTRTGLSRSSIYLHISEGRFPAPISLGGRAVGWIEAEVDDRLNRQIEESQRIPRNLIAQRLLMHWRFYPYKQDHH